MCRFCLTYLLIQFTSHNCHNQIGVGVSAKMSCVHQQWTKNNRAYGGKNRVEVGHSKPLEFCNWNTSKINNNLNENTSEVTSLLMFLPLNHSHLWY